LADAQKKYSNFLIYKEVKRFADELKALFIIFHGGIDGDINETIQQLASFRDSRTLIENKPYQALPNKMGGKFCRGATIEEIKLVKDKVKCEFCLDFGHAICAANSLGINIYEYCRELLEFKPQMYHLTDLIDITSPYDSHLHLGTGELDFKRIFEMIPNTSYITFETPKNIKTNLNDFVEDIAWFRNFINNSITLN
jgi:endonuclease IV